MRIDLTREEHKHLTQLVARSYDNNYRNDVYDTDTYDSMADKVFDAQPTVGDAPRRHASRPAVYAAHELH